MPAFGRTMLAAMRRITMRTSAACESNAPYTASIPRPPIAVVAVAVAVRVAIMMARAIVAVVIITVAAALAGFIDLLDLAVVVDVDMIAGPVFAGVEAVGERRALDADVIKTAAGQRLLGLTERMNFCDQWASVCAGNRFGWGCEIGGVTGRRGGEQYGKAAGHYKCGFQ